MVFGRNLAEHNNKIRKVFERLTIASVALQPAECDFLRKEVTYLGHKISKDGVSPDPGKISAIAKFPTPKNPTQVRGFLGLCEFYCQFIAGFSQIAKPLAELTSKLKEFIWEEAHQKAFEQLKEKLCTKPIFLQHPDFEKTFKLTTDCSNIAMGAILSQSKNGFDHPVAYFSKTLNRSQQNYGASDKECLAALTAIEHFKPYLVGRRFILVSDHEPLSFIRSKKDPSQRLMRWMFKFTDYLYEFQYKPGKSLPHVDTLSRIILEPTQEEINKKLPELRILSLNNKKSSKIKEDPVPSTSGTQDPQIKSRQGRPPRTSKSREPEKPRPPPVSQVRLKQQVNLSLPKPLHEKKLSLRPQTLLKAPQGPKKAPSAPAEWTYPPQNSDVSPVTSSEEPELPYNIANNSSNTEPPVVDMKRSL